MVPNDGGALVHGGLRLQDHCPGALDSGQSTAGAQVHRGQERAEDGVNLMMRQL